ncbi:site-specific DNA-methyltransferase [Silicimonas algicola]|nr:DNA methyltransferase [Silicimonas algicola]
MKREEADMATSKAHPAHPTNDSKRNDLLLDLTVVWRSTAELTVSVHQVRKPSGRQVKKCEASFRQFGFVTPILITAEGEIVDGHTRAAAAKKSGMKMVPCIVVDHLDERKVRALRIAVNKTQETGTWDVEKLVLELAYQLEFDTDLRDLGFDPPELECLFEVTVGAPDDADPIDSSDGGSNAESEAITRDGDVWGLGRHFIACGSARDPELIKNLFLKRRADIIISDPPYNLKVNGHVTTATKGFKEFAEASGEMSSSDFAAFLAEFLTNASAVVKPGGLLYCFMDWRHTRELQIALDKVGFDDVNLCVWVKPNGGMGSFYRSRHELVFVAKKPGAPHTNNVELGIHGRNRTNVWEYAGATGGLADGADDFTVHPTVKPIRLVEDALIDASAVGETVFDPFLGSGTTLLAAERTKRRCIGIEISPHYVDSAIRRWELMTGVEAVHLQSGATFREREQGLHIQVEAAEGEALHEGTVPSTLPPAPAEPSEGSK